MPHPPFFCRQPARTCRTATPGIAFFFVASANFSGAVHANLPICAPYGRRPLSARMVAVRNHKGVRRELQGAELDLALLASDHLREAVVQAMVFPVVAVDDHLPVHFEERASGTEHGLAAIGEAAGNRPFLAVPMTPVELD